MAQGKLEERVAELERELAALKARVATLTPRSDWRSVVGMFAGDEVMKEILEEGRKIREEDRRRTKPKPSKSKRRDTLMILLDTDHLIVLMYPENPRCAYLTARMATSSDSDFATTIVNAEEQLRGWLAAINRQRTPHRQVPPYDRLGKLLDFSASVLLDRF